MLPFVVLGGAAAVGAIGAKKGADSAASYRQAKRIAERAAARHAAAVSRFEAQRAAATEALAEYGRLRLSTYEEDLRDVADAFMRLGGHGLSELAAVDVDLAEAVRRLDLDGVNFDAIGAVKATAAA